MASTAPAEGESKRLSFAADAEEAEDKSRGTMAGVRSALAEIENRTARFEKMKAAAQEQCEGAAESDVERLKGQVSKLKGNFVNADVKARFIASLDEPNGALELREVNAEVARVSEEVRRIKKANAASSEEAKTLIASVAEGVASFEAQAEQLRADLDAIEAEDNQAEADGTGDEGMDDDEDDDPALEASLRAEEDRARALEVQLAEARSETRELEAAVLPLEGEVAMLRARARQTNAASGRTRAANEAGERATADTAWLRGAASLLEAIGGVQVQRVGEDVVFLRLVDHDVAMHLQPESSALESVVVEPADVRVDDIVAEYMGGHNLAAVVREVGERLRAHATMAQ